MYSFDDIQRKLTDLGVENKPLSGTANMIQLGSRNTTVHCANEVFILYSTDEDWNSIYNHSWLEGVCVEYDVEGKTKDECMNYLEKDPSKIIFLKHGNHSMNASAPKYQPHRIYIYSDSNMDIILDILASNRKGGVKRGMTKIDCVWIGAAALAYDACIDKDNWTLDDIYFSQQEIVNFAKDMIGDEIPNALVSQHACAYSNSQNRNCMYLVAKDVKRRISYTGEFSGKTERPDFPEMKDNIAVSTKHGEIAIDKLIKFVDEVYSPRMKQLLEEYFSQYDLQSVFDYIREYEGKHFVAVDKAGDQAAAMEKHKELGTAARACVKSFSEEIQHIMPRYEKLDMTNWINQGQNTDDYLWAQLRMKAKADWPSSVSVFFERIRMSAGERAYQIRMSVEAQDSKCGKDAEKYYKHARLLDIPKKAGLDYYVGGSLPGELAVTNKTPQEIKVDIHHSKNKKVQICKVLGESEIKSKTAYEVYQFMIQAVYELEPYYNAATADNDVEIDDGEAGKVEMSTISNPNMILYGPPGTGKTYNTVIYAVALCGEDGTLEEVQQKAIEDYAAVKERYDELRAQHRIAFTTFHQSYGYEEFIEGIKPIVDEESKDVSYSVEPGVFKKFCEIARTPADVEVDPDACIWFMRLEDNAKSLKDTCFANGTLMMDIKKDDAWTHDRFVEGMKIGDYVISYAGSSVFIDAVGVIEGEAECDETKESYQWSRKVKWTKFPEKVNVKEINGNTYLPNFSIAKMSHMKLSDLLRLLPGVDTSDEAKPYVFIIDEINRGNISKIFGELITLIENTKREGMEEAASAILPYSNQPFSVPSNVYILGTMNTADRSIALMDTALRRRFSFIEKMPDAELLKGVEVTQSGESLDVGEMLETINNRIEFLFDREHTIGHAFFMKLKSNPSIDVLADIFKRSVVPLLQEYFYEDYEKIQLVLGDNGKNDDKYKFIKNETVVPSSIFRGRSRLEKTEKYSINDSAFQWIDSYIGILNPAKEAEEDEE